MKRLYNFMLAVLFIVMLSACGMQPGTDSSADKVPEQYVQTESAETTGQAEQEQSAAPESIQAGTHTENNVANGEEQQQKQDGDNSMDGDIGFGAE